MAHEVGDVDLEHDTGLGLLLAAPALLVFLLLLFLA